MGTSTNYYMIITSKHDFEIDIENDLSIIGLPERNRKAIKNFNIGDKIIFYISKLSVFGGVAEITSDYFHSNTHIWSDHFDLWPHRREAKEIALIRDFDKMVYIKDIWDDLNFVKNTKKWGVYVQGSFRRLDKHDYTIIKNAIENRLEKN